MTVSAPVNGDLISIQLERLGFAIVANVLQGEALQLVINSLDVLATTGVGTRNVLENSWCVALAAMLKENPLVGEALLPAPVPIQCTLFDKTADANWPVAIHQDQSIPVKRRVTHPELGVWSEKEGQQFVQAPTALLQRLIALRLHIDDCDGNNGALRVVPGSHMAGRISHTEASRRRSDAGEQVCTIRAGGVMLMKPLLLHASSRAKFPRRRRVLHFLFAPQAPGYGLEWPHTA